MTWTKQGNLRGARGPRGEPGVGGGSGGEQADGYYNLETLDDTTFYGVRFDAITGRCVVQHIDDLTVIELPQDGVFRPLDYVNWVFTEQTLTFAWSGTSPSHLNMGVA